MANPKLTTENELTQILAALHSLAQLSVATQNAVLEVVQRVLVMPVVGGSGGSNSASGSGLITPRAWDGNHKCKE